MNEEYANNSNARPRMCGIRIHRVGMLLMFLAAWALAAPATQPVTRPADSQPMGRALLTLNFEHAPAKQVFEEVARQARMPLVLDPADLFERQNIPAVTLHTDREPFWQVLRKLASLTGVSPRYVENELRFSTPGWGIFDYPCAVDGPVAMFVEEIERGQSVDVAGSQGSAGRLYLKPLMMFEPSCLQDGARGLGLVVHEAVTDTGESLVISPAIDERGFHTAAAWQITLKSPSNLGGRLARFRGELRYAEVVRTQRFEVPVGSAVKDAKCVIDGRRYEIVEVNQAPDGAWTAQVRLQRDGCSDREWFNWFYDNFSGHPRPALVDAQGRTLSCTGFTHIEGGNDVWAATAVFASPGQGIVLKDFKPARLVWDIPAELRPVIVPFDLKDLPLP